MHTFLNGLCCIYIRWHFSRLQFNVSGCIENYSAWVINRVLHFLSAPKMTSSHWSTERASCHAVHYILTSMHIFNDCNRTNHLYCKWNEAIPLIKSHQPKEHQWMGRLAYTNFDIWLGWSGFCISSTISFKKWITTFYQYFVISRILKISAGDLFRKFCYLAQWTCIPAHCSYIFYYHQS